MDTFPKPSSKRVGPLVLCDLLSCVRHKYSEDSFSSVARETSLAEGTLTELRKFRSMEEVGLSGLQPQVCLAGDRVARGKAAELLHGECCSSVKRRLVLWVMLLCTTMLLWLLHQASSLPGVLLH